MGSFLSKSAVKSKSKVLLKDPLTNKPQDRHVVATNPDEKFIDLLKRVPYYSKMIHVSCKYDVYISRKNLHWFLIIKMNNSKCPYLTIEITTEDKAILATMDILEDVTDKQLVKAGEYARLEDLCDAADSVKFKMGEYNLLNNNCQHFCNNVLKWLGYQQFTTTLVYRQSTLGYEELGFDAWPEIEKHRKV